MEFPDLDCLTQNEMESFEQNIKSRGEQKFVAGTKLYSQGDTMDKVYLLINGTVEEEMQGHSDPKKDGKKK